MNKGNIESAQWAIRAVAAVCVLAWLLVWGWIKLMEYLEVPRGIWQPISLCVLLLSVAYIVLEILKRRAK